MALLVGNRSERSLNVVAATASAARGSDDDAVGDRGVGRRGRLAPPLFLLLLVLSLRLVRATFPRGALLLFVGRPSASGAGFFVEQMAVFDGLDPGSPAALGGGVQRAE